MGSTPVAKQVPDLIMGKVNFIMTTEQILELIRKFKTANRCWPQVEELAQLVANEMHCAVGVDDVRDKLEMLEHVNSIVVEGGAVRIV